MAAALKWLAGLNVGSQKIDVHLVPPDDARLEGNYALYDIAASRIWIANNLSPSNRNEKLFHELDHAVNEVSGANRLLEDVVKASRKRGAAADASFLALEENLVRARAALWPRLLQDLGFVFPKGPAE